MSAPATSNPIIVAALEALDAVQPPAGRPRLTAAQLLIKAQTLATLALAEEQRTANLIEAVRLGKSHLDHESTASLKSPASIARADRMNEIRAELRSRLALP